MARFDARRSAYLVAAILAVSFSYGLMRMPVQVSDSLSLLLDAQASPSPWSTFVTWGLRGKLLRPLFYAQVKALFDLADGHYWLIYRGFHALLLTAAILLFTRALRVRTWADFAAGVFALTVLTGLHTFRGTVREAFGINHFLEIVVFSLATLNLAQSRGGWWIDAAVAALFVAASLTLESGLLVWVIAVAAWASGMPGISRRGVMTVTLLLGVYFLVRFVYIGVELEERSSGFLFDRLEPHELNQRFGDNPIWFYAYNVVTSILSVLLSDPDGGVFEIARARLQGYVPPRLYVAVASSVLTTALIAWIAVRALRRRDVAQDGIRLLLVFAAVLLANATMSYAYTKHEILSTAGAFYALAAFAAVQHIIGYVRDFRFGFARPLLCVTLAAAATLWAFRSTGVHHMLRVHAFKQRSDWARVADTAYQEANWPAERRAEATRLVRQLRDEALEMRVV
ncbi:MAG: hypothetical protein ACREMQ_22555, partial [Longimicrobiales bacterium]